MSQCPVESSPVTRVAERNPGPVFHRTGALSGRRISLHDAQVELVRASLSVERHPDTYARRGPRPGPIQPPVVGRSSWTEAA